MDNPHIKTNWNAIDDMDNPISFVHFMDERNKLETEELLEVLRATFEHLHTQVGGVFLEVGCGTGVAASVLVQHLGVKGRVIRIDKSETMITEALKRNTRLNLPLEYHIGNALYLPFDDSSFNGCYAIGLFEIADNPQQILREMIRVTRPSGRVAIPAGDLGTWVIDSSNLAITRKILNFFSDTAINGSIGHQLPGLFQEFGLINTTIVPMTFVVTDYLIAYQRWLQNIVKGIQEANFLSEKEVIEWLKELEQRDKMKRFFLARTVFLVVGVKPEI